MRKTRNSIHICTFTSLDDLPKKKHGDPEAVYDALKKAGRFSCFEMNGTLAGTIDGLVRDGLIVVDRTVPYPWIKVTCK